MAKYIVPSSITIDLSTRFGTRYSPISGTFKVISGTQTLYNFAFGGGHLYKSIQLTSTDKTSLATSGAIKYEFNFSTDNTTSGGFGSEISHTLDVSLDGIAQPGIGIVPTGRNNAFHSNGEIKLKEISNLDITQSEFKIITSGISGTAIARMDNPHPTHINIQLSDNVNLSNGDTVTATITPIQGNTVNGDYTPIVYTFPVSGLLESLVVVKNNIVLDFDGQVPHGTVSTKSTIDHTTITISPTTDLSNGDIVTVTVTPDTNFLVNGKSIETFTYTAVGILESPKVRIGGKIVKSMTFKNRVNEFSIDGHIYTFEHDITITRDDILKFVKDNTTWATTATIDTTTKYLGLVVTYSKSTGITDGEQIIATVHYDSSVCDKLNGGTLDIGFVNIEMNNLDRTVTEAEVKAYADANIQWPSSSSSATYEIKASDYSTVNTGSTITIVLNNWTTAPKSFIHLKAGETIRLTFNNDVTWTSNATQKYIFFTIPGISGHGYTTYSANHNIEGPFTFKAGETWDFEFEKDPVLYVPPVSSANLDISKWTLTHTNLYTPDLHMVDGKEITITVQAESGYTVNGQASVDYKYIPSSKSKADIIIGVDDYNRIGIGGLNYIILYGTIPTWTSSTDKTLQLYFKTDVPVHAGNPSNKMFIGPEKTNPSPSFNFIFSSAIKFTASAGDTWFFEQGKLPVKV